MKNALKQNPKNADFFNNICMSYANIFKYKKAEEYYNQGLEIDKNNLHIINNLANLISDSTLAKSLIVGFSPLAPLTFLWKLYSHKSLKLSFDVLCFL